MSTNLYFFDRINKTNAGFPFQTPTELTRAVLKVPQAQRRGLIETYLKHENWNKADTARVMAAYDSMASSFELRCM